MARAPRRTAALRSAAVSAVAAVAVLVAANPAAAEGGESGSLVIRAVTAPTAAAAKFTFDVTCTGDGDAFTRSVVVATTGGEGAATVDGIPLDMACLVTESASSGWRLATMNPQAAIPSTTGTPVEFQHVMRAAAAVSVVKTSVPDGGYGEGAAAPRVLRGAAVRYVLTYLNTGAASADATIVDEIPAGTTYAGGVTCVPQCSTPPRVVAGRVRFAVPVDPGETGTVWYDVRVADDAAAGDVITAAPAVAQPGNGRSGTVVHRVDVPPLGLRVGTVVDRASAPVGATLTYDIDVANSGEAGQDRVSVSDVVPANTEYVAGSATCAAPCSAAYDASSRTVTWVVGALGQREKAIGLRFQARISPLTANADGSLPGTVVLNSAVATSVRSPATASNEVRTVVVAVLGRKAVGRRPPAARAPTAVPTLPATGATASRHMTLALAFITIGVMLLLAERRFSHSCAGRSVSARARRVP